jgi:hypothetical protein
VPDPREKQVELENSLRESLDDVESIIKVLSPLCETFEDMLGLLAAAKTNDATLRLVLKEVTQNK